MKFNAKCVHCTHELSKIIIYVKFTCLCTYFVKSSSNMYQKCLKFIDLYDSVPHG